MTGRCVHVLRGIHQTIYQHALNAVKVGFALMRAESISVFAGVHHICAQG
jgi:hypothetical protein